MCPPVTPLRVGRPHAARAWWRSVLLACLVVVPLHAPAQSGDAYEDDDRASLEGHLDPAERARLTELLARPVPSGLMFSTLGRVYEERFRAAVRLRVERPVVLQLLRDWVAAQPDNVSPRLVLVRQLMLGEQRQDAYRMAEQVLREARGPVLRLHLGAHLAKDLSGEGDYERARALLDEGDRLLANGLGEGRTPAARHAILAATNHHHEAHCLLSARTARLEAAVAACQRADSGAAELVRRTRGSSDNAALQAAPHHLQIRTRLVFALALSNRSFDAEQALHETARLHAEYGLPREATFYVRLARLRISQQRYAEAEALARRGLVVAQSRGMPPSGIHPLGAHELLQEALVLQGRWQEALDDFEATDRLVAGDAVALRRSANLTVRALTYLRFGRATPLRERLRALVERSEQTFGEDHFITAARRGLYGLVLADDADPAWRAQARAVLERALRAMLSPQSAGEGVEVLGIRRLVRQQVFERYIELLGDQPDAVGSALAFRVADALRGSVVQQSLNEAAVRGAAQTQGLADLVRRDQDARNELQTLYGFIARQSAEEAAARLDGVVAAMKPRIAELEGQRQRLRAEIARQFPDYERLVNPSPPTPAALAAALAPDECFISLLPTERVAHVWAVCPGGSAYHRAALPAQALAGLVARLRATLDVAAAGARAPAFDAAASAALYRALLAPVAATLGGARHLVVAPAGALGQVPFGVLLTREPTDAPPAAQPWLIRSAAVSHVASASAWMALRQGAVQRAAAEPFAGWGDPLFDRGRTAPAPVSTVATRAISLARSEAADLEREAPRPAVRYATMPPLPETRAELQAIARVLQADPVRDLRLGEQATRESVLAASRDGTLARKRVLVFATHGLVAGDLPNLTQPALALAADGREASDPLAPLLTLDDVLGLRLNADWVVLSACNTAAADGQAQEALSGLARGFFYAGSRSLLVTHWAVESASATELTTRAFAHHAAQPQARRAESLRQAMLALMEQPAYAHPAFWAPYALVGDGAR